MSNLAVEITLFVTGDDLEIRRAVTELPNPIDVAWLTLKQYPAQADLDAKLQKRITVTDVPGTGQVVAAGDVGLAGDLRFDLTPADTESLGLRKWVHDIQIKLTDGHVYTIEKGTIVLVGDVTKGTV